MSFAIRNVYSSDWSDHFIKTQIYDLIIDLFLKFCIKSKFSKMNNVLNTLGKITLKEIS